VRDAAGTHAIVPVKPFERAKTRLTRVLSPDARRLLVSAMFLDVVTALRSARAVERIWVVSLDQEILSRAERMGAEPLEEKFDMGLNRALRFATRAAAERGADRVLILPSDVPLVTAPDVDALVATSSRIKPEGLVIAVASRDGTGTNALLRTPPAVIPVCFGAGSLCRHAREAERRGVSFRLRRAPRIALDVDTLADLLVLARRARGHTAHALRRLGFL
jgi:2-phospho-L-lactate guanylyltransferase